jgi:hypothetical protein
MKNTNAMLCLFSLLLSACKTGQHYKNSTGTCQLSLYQDGSYRYKRPVFYFSSDTEHGTWQKKQDSLWLKTKSQIRKYSINADAIQVNDLQIKLIGLEGQILHLVK